MLNSMKKVKFSLKPHRQFFRSLYVFVGVIFAWAGLWDLIDRYFFPGNPLIRDLICIFLGLSLLYLPDEDLKELV